MGIGVRVVRHPIGFALPVSGEDKLHESPLLGSKGPDGCVAGCAQSSDPFVSIFVEKRRIGKPALCGRAQSPPFQHPASGGRPVRSNAARNFTSLDLFMMRPNTNLTNVTKLGVGAEAIRAVVILERAQKK